MKVQVQFLSFPLSGHVTLDIASLLGVSFFSSVNGDNSIILSPRTIVLMSAWHLVSTQYILISSLYLRLLQKAESQVTYEASCILQVTYFIFCIPATNVCSIFSYSRSITLLFYYQSLTVSKSLFNFICATYQVPHQPLVQWSYKILIAGNMKSHV